MSFEEQDIYEEIEAEMEAEEVATAETEAEVEAQIEAEQAEAEMEIDIADIDILEKIKELRELVLMEDIPSPTTPEYIELHNKMQKILKFIDTELLEEVK